MSCFRKMLYLSASVIILTQASETLANPDMGSLYPTLTSHSLELKPHNSFQLARATFLPDTKDNLGIGGRDCVAGYDGKVRCYIDISTARGDPCKGYTLFSCPTHGTCKPCLVNNNKKQLVSCSSPYLVSGNSCVCPQTVSLTYANDKCTQYCDSKCIKKTCDKSPNQTGCTNGTQSCDDGCGGTARQCCVPCTDKITSKPANSNYTYSTCVDGEGSHQIQTGWACISGYHTKDSGCEKDCNATNCSGYTLSSCPANGNCSKCTITASNCSTDGTKYKLDSCSSGYHLSSGKCEKDCEANNCSGYTLSSCPSNYVCDKCTITATNCSTGGTKYKTTGCAVNYYGVNFGDCKTVETDCAVLGYTSDSCDENKLKCPFGNKYACFEQSEPVAPPTTEDSRCAAAINGGCPYMPHYNYYMSCSYAAQSGLSSGERFRLCCGQRGCASNSAPSDSFSCSNGEVYHVCK